MGVVTLSRELGSRGDKIAELLAEKLSYRFVNKAEIERVLREDGVPDSSFEKYDEKSPGFWHRFSRDRDRYLHLLSYTVSRFAYEGDCVILGRGSQVLLARFPSILNLRVTAPFDLRVELVARQFGHTYQEAEHMVHHSDRERAGFHRFFFSESWTNTELYDLVLSTEYLNEEAAVDLICHALAALQRPEYVRETERKLANLFLEMQVITRIIYIDGLPVQNLTVTAENGTVNLRGMVSAEEDVAIVEQSARRVEGVNTVHSSIYYVPPNSSIR